VVEFLAATPPLTLDVGDHDPVRTGRRPSGVIVMSHALSRSACLLVFLLALAAPAAAQSCPGAGDTYWKNDVLNPGPGIVPGLVAFPGLCDDDRAGTVYALGGIGPQQVTSVRFGFAQVTGLGGFIAVVNVQIHDGIVWHGTTPVPGPKVFDYSDATGGSLLQLQSHGVNELDIEAFDVIVGQGTDSWVLVLEMVLNPNGNCLTGYTANLAMDALPMVGPFCDPGVTTPEQSLINMASEPGWQDLSVATQIGFPLCPTWFRGHWVMRACTRDATSPWADLGGSKDGSAGGPAGLAGSGQLDGVGVDGLHLYGAPPSETATLVFGLFALNAPFKGGTLVPDPFLLLSLSSDADGALDLPFLLPGSLPAGLPLYFQFWISDAAATFGFAASNGVRGTTQ
jgi:hypothetical protein